MSILYIAPFFEKTCLGEAATAYVRLLAKHFEVTCRPIGKIEQKNPLINDLLVFKGADKVIIHGDPTDFCWKSGFKDMIGITHLKSPLIEETDFRNYFSIMDAVYHDSSFECKGLGNIRPVFDKKEYSEFGIKVKDGRFRFLICGDLACHEEICSVIRAYSEEFRMDENVDLTVKIPQKITIPQFTEVLKIVQSDIRKYSSLAYPSISYVNAWFDRKDLLKFYNDFDCIINCSTSNEWSRPIIDCLFMGKRCISLIEESQTVEKHSYGPSENKNYPVGMTRSFVSNDVRRILREAFDGRSINRLKAEDFSEEQVLTQLMAILHEPQTPSEKTN